MEAKNFKFDFSEVQCRGDIRQAIEDALEDEVIVLDRETAISYLEYVSETAIFNEEEVEMTTILSQDVSWYQNFNLPVFNECYEGERTLHVEVYKHTLKTDGEEFSCYSYNIPKMER